MPIVPIFSVVEVMKEGINQGILRHERELGKEGVTQVMKSELTLRVVRLRAALVGIETVCSLNIATGVIPANYDKDEHAGIVNDYVTLMVDGTLLSS